MDLFGQPNTLSRSSVTEILKLSMADRDEYYADPRFADVPLAELLSDEYTAARRALIDSGAASAVRRPGDPRACEALLQPAEAGVLANQASGITNTDTTTCVT